jgi:hypothetical protein
MTADLMTIKGWRMSGSCIDGMAWVCRVPSCLLGESLGWRRLCGGARRDAKGRPVESANKRSRNSQIPSRFRPDWL